MRYTQMIVVTLIISANILGLKGQDYLKPFPILGEHLGVRQGLSQGMINSMIQDKEGYIWICTKDGLNRYDGYNIITYRNNPNDPFSLPDNFCNAILEDENENIWLGTNFNGLWLFDKKNERFYPLSNINQKKENSCIRDLQYANGKLFVRTWKDVLIIDVSSIKLNSKHFVDLNSKVLFSYLALPISSLIKPWQPQINYSINWMHDNSLWLSSPENIYKLIPGNDIGKATVMQYTPEVFGIKPLKGDWVKFFPVRNDKDKVLITCNNMIVSYDTKSQKILSTTKLNEKNICKSTITSSINDEGITLLSDSLVNIFNPNTNEIENITSIYNFVPKGSMISTMVDNNGIKWFGTSGYGVVKIDSRQKVFKNFKNKRFFQSLSKLPPEYLAPILPMNDDKIHLNSLVLDSTNTYWASMFNDNEFSYLMSYNTKDGKLTKFKGFDNRNYRMMKVYNDKYDRLWIYYQNRRNENYISRIDKKTGNILTKHCVPNSIESPEPYICQMYLDENKVMWIVTINGLYAFDEYKDKWRHWRNIPGNINSLSSNRLFCISPDPKNPEKYLWIGTDGSGINRFEKASGICKSYTEHSGLPSNVVYCMQKDSIGNIWISTNNGLSCFDPSNNMFRNYTVDDGLSGNEFNRFETFVMGNGELIFGGVDGFVIFNPQQVLREKIVSNIVFTGISIFDKPLQWKIDSLNIQAPIGYANHLTLQPGQNVFSISFASLEYRSNSRKNYQYKLDGFDENWTNPTHKHEVTYTNLSPGTYTFHVKGSNSNVTWSKNPISMEIIVLPYWYQTLWFKLILLSIITLIMWNIVRFRLQQELKVEKLRNRIARDLHDEIGTTLSSISIYAEAAKKIGDGNNKVNIILSKISDSTNEMMEAMSDIVWTVKAGSGPLKDLVNRLRSFTVYMIEAKNINLQFTDNIEIPDLTLSMEQRKNIYLISKEAINNAIKYSECTLLQVLIRKESGKLVVSIIDNGKGFSLNELKNKERALGGNGLKNMKIRATEINSTIDVITNLGEGTKIDLVIPL